MTSEWSGAEIRISINVCPWDSTWMRGMRSVVLAHRGMKSWGSHVKMFALLQVILMIIANPLGKYGNSSSYHLVTKTWQKWSSVLPKSGENALIVGKFEAAVRKVKSSAAENMRDGAETKWSSSSSSWELERVKSCPSHFTRIRVFYHRRRP